MRAPVAMRADIDDERARLDIDFVGADQEQQVQRPGLGHGGGGKPALARHKADVERADARGGGVQHGITVPVALHGELGGQRGDGLAVLAGQSAGADQDQRTFGLGQNGPKTFATSDLGQRVGTGAEMLIGVSEVVLFADRRRSENPPRASGGGCGR